MQRPLPARCEGEKRLFGEKRFLDFRLAVLGRKTTLFVVVFKLLTAGGKTKTQDGNRYFLKNDQTTDLQLIL